MNENKTKKNILNFPNFLNSGTILVILAAYIVLILVAIIVFVPKNNYTSVPNYSHTISNADISSYLELSTSLISDDDKKIVPKYTITIVLNNNMLGDLTEEEREMTVNYEVSGLTNKNTMDYMYSGSRDSFSSVPISHTLVTSKTVNGGNYKKLFGKIIYTKKSDDNEAIEKEYNFSEIMLSLSKKEKNSEISNKSLIKDAIAVSVYASRSSDADFYSISTTININFLASLYHIDYQSWIVTENGKVYPVVGFYNVSSVEKPTLTSINKVSTTLKPKYIIFKAVTTNSYGNVQVLFYKEKFENVIR